MKKEWALLIGIFLLSLAVRLYKIDQLLTFTYDQGRDFFYLEQITEGDLKLVGPTTGINGVFLGPFFYYFLLPGFIISQGSPFGVVTWQIVWICLSLVFFYFILKPYVGRRWAAIGYFWLAIIPGAIEQAHQIWNPSLTVMSILPAVYFLFESKQTHWWLAVSVFCLGLALQTELAYVVFLMPVWAAWIIGHNYWAHRHQKPWLYSLRIIALSILAFSFTLIPQIAFEVKHQGMMTKSILTELQDPTKKVSLLQVWQTRPAPLFKELNDSMTGLIAGGQFLTGVVILASLIMPLVLWRQRRQKDIVRLLPTFFLWLGYFWLPIVGMMLHTGNNGHFFDYYITAHYVPMMALLIYVASRLKSQPTVQSALLSLIVVIFARYAFFIYDTNQFDYTAAHQIAALKYARTLKTQPDTPLEVYAPNLLPVSYEYLNHWLIEKGEVEHMTWRYNGNDEYILMYEPPYDTASRYYLKQWSEKFLNETCEPQKGFGITKVRRCYSASK